MDVIEEAAAEDAICSDLKIDLDQRRCRLREQVFKEGDWLTLDGGTGLVYRGRAALVEERPDVALQRLGVWRTEAAGRVRSR